MRLESWAERRDGLLTTAVARTKISKRQIATRRESGVWRPVRRNVIAINGSPRSWHQEVRAVLLSCGVGVVASFWTALRLLGGRVPAERADGIHVSGAMNRMVRMSGVVHHRSGSFVDADFVTRDGMRCTSGLRTVIDLSGAASADDLGDIVDDLLRRKLLRLEMLRDRVASLRPAPGRSVATLRAVLAARIPGYDPGESGLETRIALLIDAGRIKRPTQQFRISFGKDRYRLDFAYPDEKIFLEGNGFGCHSIASDLDRGARRQNRLVIDGWRPLELTWRMPDDEILRTLRAVGLAA
jgi:very-short-patch-repair endonuclease